MDNATNVLEYFKQEIESISLKEKDAILVEVDGIISQAVKEYQSLAKQDADYAYQKKISEANSEQAKRIALLNSQKNKEVNELRHAIVESVFTDAKKRLEAYAKTKEYQAHLLSSLTTLCQQMDVQGATLYLNENDKQLEKEIRTIIKDECVIEVKAQIGGFILENKRVGMIVDDSYDSLLEDQKEWFYHNSGLLIK